jgi:hypothetical protein
MRSSGTLGVSSYLSNMIQLVLQGFPDDVIHRTLQVQIVYVDCLRLTYTVDAVLSLLHVPGGPGIFSKYHC